MLNTNQSNRKNIWKMALILPIIVGFIYLFQVKVVAQEKIKIEENEGLNRAVVDSAVAVGESYSINKHSTNVELKNDAASLMKDHNIDYKFSNIKRNDKDEIIAIKIEFNDNKGHKDEKVINGTEPIKPIHFTIDIDKNGKKQFGFYKFIMPKGKNIKNFVSALVTKDKNDKELLSGFSILEEENVVVRISDVKRNSKNEITSIKVVATNSDKKEVKYEQKNENGIVDFFIFKEIGGKNELKIKNLKNDNSALSETKNNKEIIKKLSEAKTSIKSNEVKVPTSPSDIAPAPQNGLQEFRKQIAMKFKLPEVKSDVNASIVVKFLVLKTGEISTITILKEDPKDLGLGDELTRVLKESPNWKPGTKDGKPADLYFVLPVMIKIEASK